MMISGTTISTAATRPTIAPAFNNGGAPSPSHLSVPGDIRARLSTAFDAALAAGAAWRASHPGSSALQFDADVAQAAPIPPNGIEQAADIEAVLAAAHQRTPSGILAAKAYAKDSGQRFWTAALDRVRQSAGPAQATRALALLEDATHRADTVSDIEKQRFARLRPFEQDSRVTTVVKRPSGSPSYPSGHTTAAYAAATVLASFLPNERASLLDIAAEVAWSRVYGGVHYPTDVLESVRVGAQIAADAIARNAQATR